MSAPILPAATYYIQNQRSELYIRPANSGEKAQLVQDRFVGDTKMYEWGVLYVHAALRQVRLFNALTGYSVDAADDRLPPPPTTALVQRPWEQKGNQVWRPDTLIAEEYGAIASPYDPNTVWDVELASKGPGARVTVFGRKVLGNDNQLFRFVPVPQPQQVLVPTLAGEPAEATRG